MHCGKIIIHDLCPIEKILMLFSNEENMRKSARIFKFFERNSGRINSLTLADFLEEFENPRGIPRVFPRPKITRGFFHLVVFIRI